MEKTLTFTTKWRHLEEGSPEERAAFGAIGLRVNKEWLSTGRDKHANLLRNAPLLSGFHLAEWIAWNWWRLRWEPRPRLASDDWMLAHQLTSVGSGYMWPNVTIWSDGERTYLATRPTSSDSGARYHYVVNLDTVISSQEFERATDSFINCVCSRIDEKGIQDSNLHILWNQLKSDRSNEVIHRRRKLEALLGFDQGEAEPEILDTLIEEATNLGESAIDELAVAGIVAKRQGIAKKLEDFARNYGFNVSVRDGFHFGKAFNSIVPTSDKSAWVVGSHAAKTVRRQASLGEGPISNKLLCDLVAVPNAVLSNNSRSQKISHKMGFVLGDDRARKIVLRSTWETDRRFEMARLAGDQLVRQYSGRLHPATNTYTYRQKLQRTFAAELLSPFEEINHALEGDYSQKKQRQVAEHFNVAPMTIKTHLVNKGLSDREGLEMDRLLHLR